MDDFIAGPAMCSASTVYRSLVESEIRPGDWACFIGGGGGVGIQGVQLAKAMGFRPIVVDSGAEKRALCERMGAEAFVDFREVPDAAAEVKRVADDTGAHAVFVTAVQAYPHAIDYVGSRVGAKVMCIGLREYILCFLSYSLQFVNMDQLTILQQRPPIPSPSTPTPSSSPAGTLPSRALSSGPWRTRLERWTLLGG